MATNNPHKEMLTTLVMGELTDLLLQHGNRMLKVAVHDHLNAEFVRRHGSWPAELDEPDGDADRTQWANAYGHALRLLNLAKVTKSVKETGDFYELDLV